MRIPFRRRRGDDGAAAVEFALVTPLLLLIVLGIIDFGWMLMQANLVSNSARDGARVASLSGTYAQIVATVNGELDNGGITASNVVKEIGCSNTSGTTCDGTEASYTTNSTSGSTVTVTVRYTHTWITPFGAVCSLVHSSCVGDTMEIERTSTMVRE